MALLALASANVISRAPSRRTSSRAVLPTLSQVAASRTVRPFAIMLRARASLSGSMTGFRPPFRPRAATAARPARVRSRIRSRSNWPSAPKRWNTSRPPGVVLIPLMTQHYAMLQRNLLYTGVTRGKRLVVLVGQKKAVAIAVHNASGRRRWSKLNEWMVGGHCRARMIRVLHAAADPTRQERVGPPHFCPGKSPISNRLRGRPAFSPHDARRLRRARSRFGDPAGARRVAPASARAQRGELTRRVAAARQSATSSRRDHLGRVSRLPTHRDGRLRS